jgi:hypothetical protein
MVTILLNSVILNAVVAAALAVVVWAAGMIPAIRRRPGLRHALWIVVLLKYVTPPLFELSILPTWFLAEAEPGAHALTLALDDPVGLPALPSSEKRVGRVCPVCPV